jgi:hypothetical protein
MIVVVVVLVVVPEFESRESSPPPGSLWSLTVDTGLITVVRCEIAVVVGVVGGATG